MMDESLRRVAEATEKRLIRFFSELESSDILPFSGRVGSTVLDAVRELTLRGGKRLRAGLLVSAATLFDERAEERGAALDAAAALELLQTYFLIHDDIMDGDGTRRGGPAAHVALARAFGSDETGRNLGILAGDLAAALHEVLLSGLDAPALVKVRVRELFAAMHMQVVHGQALDLIGGAEPLDVAASKTASYTAVGPLAIGACVAGAAEDQIQRLAAAGWPLGIAFQLRDDLLGMFGDEHETGKPVCTDLKIGKRTYLIEKAISMACPEDRAAISRVLGNERACPQELEAARAAISASGARRHCEDEIERRAGEFERVVLSGAYLPSGRELLLHAGRRLTERKT